MKQGQAPGSGGPEGWAIQSCGAGCGAIRLAGQRSRYSWPPAELSSQQCGGAHTAQRYRQMQRGQAEAVPLVHHLQAGAAAGRGQHEILQRAPVTAEHGAVQRRAGRHRHDRRRQAGKHRSRSRTVCWGHGAACCGKLGPQNTAATAASGVRVGTERRIHSRSRLLAHVPLQGGGGRCVLSAAFSSRISGGDGR